MSFRKSNRLSLVAVALEHHEVEVMVLMPHAIQERQPRMTHTPFPPFRLTGVPLAGNFQYGSFREARLSKYRNASVMGLSLIHI